MAHKFFIIFAGVLLLVASSFGLSTNGPGPGILYGFTNITPLTTLTITNQTLSATNAIALRLEGILDMGGNDITNAGVMYVTETFTTNENVHVTNFVVVGSFEIGGDSFTNLTDGVPSYESDPVWSAASNLYATGTPVYVEADPVWVAASSLYYTASAADAKFATGTPIYVESGSYTAGFTTTGGITNNVGFFGNAAGLTNLNQAEIAASTSVVHLAGTETITGAKTFSGAVTLNGAMGGDINMNNRALDSVGAITVDSEGIDNWDDVCAYLPHAWAGAYVTNPVGTTCSNEFVFMLSDFLNSSAREFQIVGSNLTFVGNAGTGVFEVIYSGAFTCNTATVSGFVGLRKNGTLQPQFTRGEYMKTAGESYGISAAGLLTLVSNDFVDIVVKSSSASDVVIVPENFTTTIKRLGTY